MSEDTGQEDNYLVNGIEVRRRTRPDPLHTSKCPGCNTTFWYKKSHGELSYNGESYCLRVVCPWCARGNYIKTDDKGVPTNDQDSQE